jgi:hypothetical protein
MVVCTDVGIEVVTVVGTVVAAFVAVTVHVGNSVGTAVIFVGITAVAAAVGVLFAAPAGDATPAMVMIVVNTDTIRTMEMNEINPELFFGLVFNGMIPPPVSREK